MDTIRDKKFDEERALYASKHLRLVNVAFDGAADGESALKESSDIIAENCYCNLRYPFWHNSGLTIKNCELTPLCRAALWYTQGASISFSSLLGIKAVRECKNVRVEDCTISSPEFGWFSDGITMQNTSIESEYLFLRTRNISLNNVDFKGKYSFQYVENARLENCKLYTKDAFWHGKNMTIKNCVVKGEYLAWYSENLTFIDCVISGTQPFCYCKGLKLINCRMENCDLSFEKSEAEATLLCPIDSIKNFYAGEIRVPAVGAVICDDERALGKIMTIDNNKNIE